MLLNRTSSPMAIGLLAILLASPALGQGPLGMQLFGDADISTFGTPPPPNEGYFFSFDGLYWSVQRPQTAMLGAPGSRLVGTHVIQLVNGEGDLDGGEIQTFLQRTTESTAPLVNEFQAGQRFEFGRVEDYRGWIASIYRLQGNDQNFLGHGAAVLLTDSFGLLYGQVGTHVNTYGTGEDKTQVTIRDDFNLPVTFDTIQVSNHIDTWGVEVSYLRRTMTFHDGGNMEFYLGARYLEFNEDFNVIGTGGVLDSSFWNTSAGNHIVGPQVGARYFKRQGRWTFSTEGRFMAGYNSQNLSQDGIFAYTGNPGDLLKPIAWPGDSFSSRATIHEFSPVVELRLDMRYMITRAISFRAGWSGIWMDGIARPSGMVNYSVPSMGIDTTKNCQHLLINGLTMGIDINR